MLEFLSIQIEVIKNNGSPQLQGLLTRNEEQRIRDARKILLAESTGYLGIYIAKELQQRSCFFRAIARSPEKLEQNDIKANELLKAELTDPESIRECCKGIDIVISTVGITKQKDGLTYMDVDYQANMG